MLRKKIGLVGSGNIGGVLAHLIGLKELGDVVQLDVIEGRPAGKSADLAQSTPISGAHTRYSAAGDYADLKDADVVVVTAAVPKAPGDSRDAFTRTHCEMMRRIGLGLRDYCPNAFVICVTNPIEILVAVLHEVCGMPAEMIVGLSGVLDSGRLRFFIAEALGTSVEDVRAVVLGNHGPTMIPLLRNATVGGVPLPDLVKRGWVSEEHLADIVTKTRQAGKTIGSLLNGETAYYAPAAAVAEMIEAYLKDQKRVLPCTTLIKPGEYGQLESVFLGVPIVLGGRGAERVVEFDLDDEEQAAFDKAAEKTRRSIDFARTVLREAAST